MALTKQGTERIEIIVKKSVDGGQEGAKEKDTDSANDEENKEQKDATLSKHIKRTRITHAIGLARQGMHAYIGYEVGGIGYTHGDSNLQERTERLVEQVSDGASLLFSTAMGGVTMGAVGAVIGFAQSGIQIATKYATRQRDYDYAVFKQNSAIEYKRARAQINLTTGRLR